MAGVTGEPNTLFVFGHHRHGREAGWRGGYQHPRDHTLYMWVPASGSHVLRGVRFHRIVITESTRDMVTQHEWASYHEMLSMFPEAVVIGL